MKKSEIIISRDGVNVINLSGLQTETAKERLGGLLVINKLQDKEALWLTPCNSIHTMGMKYGLDLIYVDKTNKICKLSEHIKPWRISVCYQAKATIEMIAGSIRQFDIQKGDECIWQN